MNSVKYFLACIVATLCITTYAQQHTKRVLFLGNSYTYSNNLPQMLADAALSAGDTVLHDSNAPGGYTFEGHSTNATSLSKIAQGTWDYVVLQEQSQLPSFPDFQVQSDVYPFAAILNDSILAANPCTETVFFMTWGRKNGDASNCANWPPVCSYEGMDSLLNLRYRIMADDNEALVSPAGAVWNYIRETAPQIELYNPDESHPSVAGTYAAACTFYATLFRSNPENITYNSSLSSGDAAIIRAAAKLVVYDSLLNWHIGEYDPQAQFTYSATGATEITFTNTSQFSTVYNWNFGDGNSSVDQNPVHTYATTGTYTVELAVENCGMQDTVSQIITIDASGIESTEIKYTIYPNPVSSVINIGKELHSNLTYRIFNSSGKLMQAGDIINRQQIPVVDLAEGIYLLQLVENNKPVGLIRFIKAS